MLARRSRPAQGKCRQPRLPPFLERRDVDRLRLREQPPDDVHAPDLVGNVGGTEQARPTSPAVGTQGGGPLERRDGDGQGAAAHRTVGGIIEQHRDRLVWKVSCRGVVPGRPIDVAHDTRDCGVGTAPISGGRALLDRRPDERVAESHRRCIHLQQPRVDRERDRRFRNSCSGDDLRQAVAIIERGDQDKPLRRVRKVVRLRRERALEASVERQDIGDRIGGSGVVADRRRQLRERERVPCRLPDDAIAHRSAEIWRQV
jgi:hypothetical protein